MRKLTLAAMLFAAAAATPALAQDANRTGNFHVTGIVGYDTADAGGVDAEGVVYGIGAGYDFNIGRNVFAGPEAELTFSSAEECAGGINRAGDQLCAEAGRDIYVGGRIGVRVSPRASLYVGAGYTNAEYHSTYDANLAGTTGDFDISDDLDGYRLKAGGELGIGRNMFVRAEYRFSDYEGGLDRHQVVGGFGIRF